MATQISYEQAADILGVVPSYIYQLVSAGKLHSIKTPGSTKKMLSRSEVEAYRTKNDTQPHSLQYKQEVSIKKTISPAVEKRRQFNEMLQMVVNTTQGILSFVEDNSKRIQENNKMLIETLNNFYTVITPAITKVVDYPLEEEELKELIIGSDGNSMLQLAETPEQRNEIEKMLLSAQNSKMQPQHTLS